MHFFAEPAGSMTSPSIFVSGLEWHQIVVRKSGPLMEMFYDNAVIASGSAGAIPATSAPLLLGRRDGSQEFPFLGRMDEIAIWNRSLNAGEIAQLYNNGNGLQLTVVPEPVAPVFAVLVIAAIAQTGRRKQVRPTVGGSG